MKNLIFLFGFLFMFSSLSAQKKDTRSTKYNDFVTQVNDIKNSDMPEDLKEDRIYRATTAYMKNQQTVKTRAKFAEYDNCIKNGKGCDRDRVIKHLTSLKEMSKDDMRKMEMQAKNQGVAKGDDKDRLIAINIYRSVGASNFAPADECKGRDCDRIGQVQPKTRGASVSVWKYIGEKKYFTDEEQRGWMYLCQKMTLEEVKKQAYEERVAGKTNQDEDEKGEESEGEKVEPGQDDKAVTAWKSEKNVDIWK